MYYSKTSSPFAKPITSSGWARAYAVEASKLVSTGQKVNITASMKEQGTWIRPAHKRTKI